MPAKKKASKSDESVTSSNQGEGKYIIINICNTECLYSIRWSVDWCL